MLSLGKKQSVKLQESPRKEESKNEIEGKEGRNRVSDIDDNAIFISLEEAYQNSRGSNLFYTLYVFYECIMSYSFGSLLPFSFPFLIKLPELECNNNLTNSWVYCSQADACNNKYFEYRINYESNETITNWITLMDLVCASDYQIGLFGSMYFIGFFIGSLCFMRIADIKGRRIITIISIIGTIILGILIFAINIIN